MQQRLSSDEIELEAIIKKFQDSSKVSFKDCDKFLSHFDDLKSRFPDQIEEAKKKCGSIIFGTEKLPINISQLEKILPKLDYENKFLCVRYLEKVMLCEEQNVKQCSKKKIAQKYVHVIQWYSTLSIFKIYSAKKIHDRALECLEDLLCRSEINETITSELSYFAQTQEKGHLLKQYRETYELLVESSAASLAQVISMLQKIIDDPRFEKKMPHEIFSKIRDTLQLQPNAKPKWLAWVELKNILSSYQKQRSQLDVSKTLSEQEQYVIDFCNCFFEDNIDLAIKKLKKFHYPIEDLMLELQFLKTKLKGLAKKSRQDDSKKAVDAYSSVIQTKDVPDDIDEAAMNEEIERANEELNATRSRYINCLHMIAERYQEGISVDANQMQAMKYYQLSVAQGDAKAKLKLGDLYQANQLQNCGRNAVDAYVSIFEEEDVPVEIAKQAMDRLIKRANQQHDLYAQEQLRKIENKIYIKIGKNPEEFIQLKILVFKICSYKKIIANWVYENVIVIPVNFFAIKSFINELNKLEEIFQRRIAVIQMVYLCQDAFSEHDVLNEIQNGYSRKRNGFPEFFLLRAIQQCNLKLLQKYADFFDHRSTTNLLNTVELQPVIKFNRLLTQARSLERLFLGSISQASSRKKDQKDLSIKEREIFFELGKMYQEGVGGRKPQLRAATYCFYRAMYYPRCPNLEISTLLIASDFMIHKKAFDQLISMHNECADALYYLAWFGEPDMKTIRIQQAAQRLNKDNLTKNKLIQCQWSLRSINASDGYIVDLLEIEQIRQILKLLTQDPSLSNNQILEKMNEIISCKIDDIEKIHQLILYAMEEQKVVKNRSTDSIKLIHFICALANIDAVEIQGLYSALMNQAEEEDEQELISQAHEKELIVPPKKSILGDFSSFFRTKRQSNQLVFEYKTEQLNEDSLPELERKLDELTNELSGQGIVNGLISIISSELKSEECIDQLEAEAKRILINTEGLSEKLVEFLIALTNREMPQLLVLKTRKEVPDDLSQAQGKREAFILNEEGEEESDEHSGYAPYNKL